MEKKILIVEDYFVEANNIQIILKKAGYRVLGIAASYEKAMVLLETDTPDLVILDIFLAGEKTGIDLAAELNSRGIAFVYLSANSNPSTLQLAKETQPYGFLVKPLREKDILVSLDIALYLHQQKHTLRRRASFLASFPEPANLPDIIGSSPRLLQALEMIQVVAPTDTSVLVLGESGTGKEGIANAIHLNSARRSYPLVKVNCATLPANLVESELFGHERGSFTGATDQRIGKFEQAHNGTIFLDEIGEMPFELQAKLLRVLQEKEIDRLGGKASIRVNTRIIAATNLNLEREMQEGRFRMDLYFRLNVFPITLPPLRDRLEDIPLLATHFIRRYCAEYNLPVKTIADKALRQLLNYPWSGNIRELQHLIERTVLVTPGSSIAQFQLSNPFQPAASAAESERVKTIDEIETEHIKSVLKKSNGKLSGPGGAAELLKIPYSTLVSKMYKLGIKPEKRYE